MNLPLLADAPIESGTRVLLRAGLNVPVDAVGVPMDAFRLSRALPTIEHLSAKGARTVIVAHLGRDGMSLEHVGAALQKLTKVPVRFFGGPLAEAAAQPIGEGECLLLENIRREKGEEENDSAFTTALAALGSVFVNDAFADSHRAHASIVGVAERLRGFAGLLMQEEVEHLSYALTPPPSSVAIVGGAKFETKEPLITKLLELYERVCVGGALANDFFKTLGLPMAASTTSRAAVPMELARDPRILLPVDGVLQDAGGLRTAPVAAIKGGEKMQDAGPATVSAWESAIASAPLILWNGTLGVCEDGFAEGTTGLAKVISEHCQSSDARAIIGGGDTVAAIEGIAFEEKNVFKSTGGGAMLEFLTDGTLIGLAALKK